MKPTYTISIVPVAKTISNNSRFSKNGQLVQSARGWIGYFGKHENSYDNECTVISAFIVSNEDLKEDDYITSRKTGKNVVSSIMYFLGEKGQRVSQSSLVQTYEHGVLETQNCRKIIGNAPKNIIDNLISGKMKDGDEVEVIMQKYHGTEIPKQNSDATIICK